MCNFQRKLMELEVVDIVAADITTYAVKEKLKFPSKELDIGGSSRRTLLTHVILSLASHPMQRNEVPASLI